MQSVFGVFPGTFLIGLREDLSFTAKDHDGNTLIDPLSHVGLAARENNDGVMILAVHLVSKRSPRFYSPAEPTWRPPSAQRIPPPHRVSYLRDTARA
jgi:hypothetical protein